LITQNIVPGCSADSVDDTELIRRFLKGDESAFVEIVTRYRSKMFSVAFNLLHNHTDAEEIAQDTFIKAHRNLAKFRGDSSLSTWLHRIALNLARNRYWYFFRRRRHSSLSIDAPVGQDGNTTFADFLVSDGPTPEDEILQGELTEIIARQRKRLSTPHREILTLLIERHLSYEQMAEVLYLETGTVKSRLARARAELAALVSEEFADIQRNGKNSEAQT
jgi:RNA polymerase sigma-70 factor (ECF subfamily)